MKLAFKKKMYHRADIFLKLSLLILSNLCKYAATFPSNFFRLNLRPKYELLPQSLILTYCKLEIRQIKLSDYLFPFSVIRQNLTKIKCKLIKKSNSVQTEEKIWSLEHCLKNYKFSYNKWQLITGFFFCNGFSVFRFF